MRKQSVKMLCTDLDGTVYGDPGATGRFREFWEGLEERPLLCFNSGRLIPDQLQLLQISGLPKPDFMIGGVGTRILNVVENATLAEYEEPFAAGWDLTKIEKVMRDLRRIQVQPAEFQTEFKSSWYWDDATDVQLEELKERLKNEGLDVSVIYSSNRDLDVLPARADKGDAMSWLCRHLEIETRDVVVAGDTGNDVRMFLVRGVRGIVVGNAKPELLAATEKLPVFRATRKEADGVVEGLRFYGVGV